jgi:hypothetical protein
VQHARRLAGLVVLAAILTFCLVQDAETSAGVGRYISAQRLALAGQGPRVTVDEVMGPANRLAVREGMAWSGRVAMAGLIGLLIYRRVRLKPDTTPDVRLKPDTTSDVRLEPDTTSDTTRARDRRG